MNKKTIIKCIAIISIVIILCALAFFVFIYKNPNEDFTLAEKMMFNKNELEVITVLNSLNFSNDEDNSEGTSTNIVGFDNDLKVSDLFINIYELRKITSENGTNYLFDADIKVKDEINRRKICIKDNKIIGITFVESDYEQYLAEYDKDSFAYGFAKAVLDAYSEAVEKAWNEAEVIENVNYSKIMSKLK